MSKRRSIQSVTNESLSGVAFVHDYVEFHFDGKIIRSLTNPVIAERGQKLTFPTAGSRDVFCSLIGQTVDSVIVEDGVRIQLEFSSGATLEIPLAESDRICTEAAHFVVGDNQPIDVW